jgi:hypothetical protein
MTPYEHKLAAEAYLKKVDQHIGLRFRDDNSLILSPDDLSFIFAFAGMAQAHATLAIKEI